MINYLKYRANEFLYGGEKVKIPRGSLVLEIASGGKPYWRSNVLLDKFILDNSERDAGYAVIDRDFVVGDVMKLPFKDKAFDFVVARHILEHIEHPDEFLKELQRVAKNGYIETPSPLSEELYGWPFHVWKISVEDGKLLLDKRGAEKNVQLKKLQAYFDKDKNLKEFALKNRDLFYTGYYWSDKIGFSIFDKGEFKKEVLSSNYSLENFSLSSYKERYSIKTRIKIIIDNLRRKMCSKNLEINLINLMQCPDCGGDLDVEGEGLSCKKCRRGYVQKDGIPVML